MPIDWSPVDPNVLFYASNAVWKTTDQAHSWTRISADLARQTWDSAGERRQVREHGDARRRRASITALSPSPRDVNVLWAGTDDGNIQVTTDGGAKWTNVTPPQIKPWTRIFNIDAGHFDTQTAYAAANTLRARRHESALLAHARRRQDVDGDQQRHRAAARWRTRFAKIRARRDCSTRATDTQVWVSFDDGDHWQSLRLDMPAISVRDIQVKDDSTCLCSDLVAGTHGRGFWILDDVTPLRQAAADARGAAARAAYLVQAGDGGARSLRARTIRRRGRPKCPRARIRRRARSSTTTSPANASAR